MANIVHHPEAYTLALGAREMDDLVEGLRVYVRDYEVPDRVKQLLAGIEEAYVGERAGGRVIELKALTDLADPPDEPVAIEPVDEDGEGGVPA
jgi:hypothetical protein